MPEGPEVRVIADTITKGIGKAILKADHTKNKKYKWQRDGIPGWDKLSQADIWFLNKVDVKGKLIRMDLSYKDQKLSVLNTLGLEGVWIWDVNTKHPMYKHKRVWFNFPQGQLAYCDSRNFGTIRVMTPKEADKKVKKIGHDLLQSPMPAVDWLKLQSNKSIGSKPIGEALMQQKHFSGIGNIYKAETLFNLKINPTTLVEDLEQAKWLEVNDTAHKILAESYKEKGSSVKSYEGGSFQRSLLIYKKKTCPSGHPVSSIEQAKRTTWYCPTCQT